MAALASGQASPASSTQSTPRTSRGRSASSRAHSRAHDDDDHGIEEDAGAPTFEAPSVNTRGIGSPAAYIEDQDSPLRDRQQQQPAARALKPRNPAKAPFRPPKATPKKTGGYPQPLPDLAPNNFEINMQYEALSCGIDACRTNQHHESLGHFKDFRALKRHASESHGEQFDPAYNKARTGDHDFLVSGLVHREPVTGDELGEIRETGDLPEPLRPRAPLTEFVRVPVKRRSKRTASEGQDSVEGSSRNKGPGNAAKRTVSAPAIDEEEENEMLDDTANENIDRERQS